LEPTVVDSDLSRTSPLAAPDWIHRRGEDPVPLVLDGGRAG